MKRDINLNAAALAFEQQQFRATHRACAAASQRCETHFLYGAPLHWMSDWGLPGALHVREAQAARLCCCDDVWLDDFCLGDTGAMFGHSPAPLVQALREQLGRGLTTMLPSQLAAEVGELLAQRFGLPMWQMAATASDANRFVLRWARAVTARPCIVVFDGCYHGTVDDTLVDWHEGHEGRTVARASLLGQVQDLSQFTRVVPFNDLDALASVLRDEQVACVLTEPALTNIGMVLPEPGFLQGVRALTQRHGTLLVMDETHTLSVGPSGACGAWGIAPDCLVVGKAIAGGLPCAVYGFTAELAARMRAVKDAAPPGHSGIGTTLSGNALSLAALHANLTQVMTAAHYAHMLHLAEQLVQGLRDVIAARRLPWCVTQLGARAEFQYAAQAPRNAEQARAAFDDALDGYLRLALLNRASLITPFHNMLLLSPATEEQAVQRLCLHFAQALDAGLSLAH